MNEEKELHFVLVVVHVWEHHYNRRRWSVVTIIAPFHVDGISSVPESCCDLQYTNYVLKTVYFGRGAVNSISLPWFIVWIRLARPPPTAEQTG